MFKLCKVPVYLSLLRRGLLWLIFGISVAGCSKSYVVLLENDDGSIGKVNVTTTKGTTVLAKHHEGEVIGDEPGNTFTVTQDQINRDFGCSIAASPKKPISFYLYFEKDTAKLTHESAADIPKIIDEILTRQAPDISVISYAGAGESDKNQESLSLIRAKGIAAFLDAAHLDDDKVSVEWHGRQHPPVQKPGDNLQDIDQRVEITVR